MAWGLDVEAKLMPNSLWNINRLSSAAFSRGQNWMKSPLIEEIRLSPSASKKPTSKRSLRPSSQDEFFSHGLKLRISGARELAIINSIYAYRKFNW